jgi:hypothetical protein
MQINIDNLIESWFSNASPKDQLAFLKKLLVSTASEPVPTKSYGLTTKQVMEKARKPSMHIKPTVLGKEFKSMKAAAAHYGIPYHTVQYRKEKGQNIEQIYREAYAADKDKKNKIMRRNEDGSITVTTARNR